MIQIENAFIRYEYSMLSNDCVILVQVCGIVYSELLSIKCALSILLWCIEL